MLAFIGTFWWLWLVLMIIFVCAALLNLVRQFHRSNETFNTDGSNDSTDQWRIFFGAIAFLIIFGFLAIICGGLFILSLEANFHLLG